MNYWFLMLICCLVMVSIIPRVYADDNCYLYKSPTLAIVKYGSQCVGEIDAFVKSGFKIAFVIPDLCCSVGVDGRVYLTK